MRLHFFILCLVLGIGGFLDGDLYAQTPNIQLSFSRQNNFSYPTSLTIGAKFQKGAYRNTLSFQHANLVNSSRKDNPFVQLYFRTNFWQYYRLSPKLEFSTWLESNHYFNAGTHRSSLYAGINYQLNESFFIRPMLGYSLDFRSMILNTGISPALLIEGQQVLEDGVLMGIRAFIRAKYIRPRHHRNISIENTWAKQFEDRAQIAFKIKAGSNEIDNFRSASIEKLISDTLNPTLYFRYQLLPGLTWDSENSYAFTRRGFKFETYTTETIEFNNSRFDQFDIYSQQKLNLGTPKFRASLGFTYQNLIRQYDLDNSLGLREPVYDQLLDREQQKDYFRRLANWELRVNYDLGDRQELILKGSNRYVQYDTPSASNFDDHDELSYALSLEWKSRWTRSFFTRYRLLGNVRRYAFLFKERSQDNYTQRSLRMDFLYRWEPWARVVIQGEQFIYVSYNVKDFTDVNFTDRSTRNLESRLTIDYQPNRKWEMNTSLYRKELHVSYLNWEEFSETTLDTALTYILEHTNQWKIKSRWKNIRMFMEGGYKHVSQGRRFNSSMINEQNFLVPINLKIRNFQTGFVTGYKIFRRNPASIEASIWWQFQYLDYAFTEIQDLVSLSANYRQETLEQVIVNFRPFVKLKMNFWIKGS